ncbi:MAG: helix-turn-helix transcriptional regulator [Gemmatimonadaceae bacterium]
MAQRPKRTRSLTGTRGRIVDLIRRTPLTAREIAEELGLTYHAVRQHVLILARDGVIRVNSVRGTTRPASVYEVAPDVESTLSRAYVPFASHLTRVLSERLPERQFGSIMREVGHGLAAPLSPLQGTLRERALAASALLLDLGSPNEVGTRGRSLTIKSSGCLLAEAIHGRPEVCQTMAVFLGDLLAADVRQRCDRGERPRCCFEIRRAG